MILPKITRLRYVSAKKPQDIVAFFAALGVRVQLYGSPTYDGKRWFAWFVPNDEGADIKSIDL